MSKVQVRRWTGGEWVAEGEPLDLNDRQISELRALADKHAREAKVVSDLVASGDFERTAKSAARFAFWTVRTAYYGSPALLGFGLYGAWSGWPQWLWIILLMVGGALGAPVAGVMLWAYISVRRNRRRSR